MMHCLFSLKYLNSFSLILAANFDTFSSEKYNYSDENCLIFSPTVHTKLYHLYSGHTILLLWMSLVSRGPFLDLGQCLHLNYWMLTPLAYARVHCWLLASIPLQPSLFSVSFSSADVHTIKIPVFTENKSFLECIIPFQVLPHFWEIHYREDPHNIFHFPLWSYKQLWAYIHSQLNVHSFLNFFLFSILPFPFKLPPMTFLSSTSVNQLWSEPPVITSVISRTIGPFLSLSFLLNKQH